MILQENPAFEIGVPEDENDVTLENGAVTYYFTMSWAANSYAKLPEIPPSFDTGIKDIEEGRLVDLDVALTETPPSAQISRD